jgi:hypothetical protein
MAASPRLTIATRLNTGEPPEYERTEGDAPNGAPPSPASILLDGDPEANSDMTHTRASML